MVSSNEVLALACWPKRMPTFSMKSTISCFLNRRVPLKAMCSTKWASPRSFSVSSTEPAFTASRRAARWRGSWWRRR